MKEQNLPYTIIKNLGTGASASVYLVRDAVTQKRAALKIIHDERYGENAGEREVLAKLFHPGLPHIWKVWTEQEETLVLMDYVEGVPLVQRMKTLSYEERVDKTIGWGIQLCKIFIYLHGQNPPFLYRDLKPENIMCDEDDRIRLVDFGAVMKKTGKRKNDCMGTPGYAAPEQYARSGKIDVRTDIFCLGRTLLHILTGERPLKSPPGRAGKRGGRSKKEAELYRIIGKCTRKKRFLRYSSCKGVLVALEKAKQID